LQALPNVQEELQLSANVTQVVPLLYAVQTYHVVTPVPHCPFKIVCAAIRFAKALKSLDAKQLYLFLLGDCTNRTTQCRGLGEIRFEIADKSLVEFVEYGNLDVDQEGQLLTEGSQGSVSICTLISNLGSAFEVAVRTCYCFE
jgi:hypothetical protein